MPETTDSPHPRVFMSHSTKDKPFVEKLASALETHGMHAWMDSRELVVGDSIVQGVSAALGSSDYVVVVLSENSVQSKWVQQELSAALMAELGNRGVTVLPVRLDSAPVPPILLDRVYADFRGDFQAGADKLIAAIGQEREIVRPATLEMTKSLTPSCEEVLGALKQADLRRRICKRFSRNDLAVVWFDTFGSRLNDDMPEKPLDQCAIELILRAKQRDATTEMCESLCYTNGAVANG